MKLLYTILFITPLFSLLFSSGCKKINKSNDDGLPPLTFEGKNTIGCKINGQPWVPKGIYDPSGIQYPVDGGFFEKPPFQGVHVLIKGIGSDYKLQLFCRQYDVGYLVPGKYYLNKNTPTIHGYGQIHSYGFISAGVKQYITDSLHTGWIEVLKADPVTKIVSGRFQFEAFSIADNKIIKITDGRFDVK